jgi:H+-translocating NAD(P) transhydrogenase subunit alpha
VLIGIPKEILPGERRVAATPDSVAKLIKLGFSVAIESGAGALASYEDSDYEAAGATVVDGAALWATGELILKINPPMQVGNGIHESDRLAEGAHLISLIQPAQNGALVERLATRGATVLAMDCIPRISRAQKMDALSSMGNIAGYRAVIEAASCYGSFFTGQFTAAGKVPPAKVLVIGAGVAGLAAIGAARGLGAIVRAFDTRAAAKEQVQSMGAEFLEVQFEEDGDGGGGYAKVMSPAFIEAEMALFMEQAKDIDIVITTALIPGKPAPVLWTEDHVKAMKRGSVVVDMAASQGGNCPISVAGEHVVKHGVNLVGYTDLTSRLSTTASTLYAQNLVHLLTDMVGDDGFHIDHDDEVVRGALVLERGEIMWPPPKVEAVKPAPAPLPAPEVAPETATPAPVSPTPETSTGGLGVGSTLVMVALLGLWAFLRYGGLAESVESLKFLQHFTVFVLACFVGWQVVWNVTAALHTPLMSVTNAISGIIIVGGLLQSSGDLTAAATLLGLAAVFFATINIAGGFLVTKRMLAMFRK